MSDHSWKSQTQEFIEIYNSLKAEGALDEEKIMEVGKSLLEDKVKARREDAMEKSEARAEEIRSEAAVKKTEPPKRQVDVAEIFAQ